MIFALVTGQVFRAPEQRTSKAGKPFVTATIRVKDGEASVWWKIAAFSEGVQTGLMRLGDGDALSVQGSFKAELYRPDVGEPKGFPLDHCRSGLGPAPAAESTQAQDVGRRARPRRRSGFR